jgi:hypothetical protein
MNSEFDVQDDTSRYSSSVFDLKDNPTIEDRLKHKEVEILFKIPQETIPNITLKLSIDLTIGEIKKQIEIQHSHKPSAVK